MLLTLVFYLAAQRGLVQLTKLTFQDFFPGKKITTVHTGSELLLAYELSKYCRLMLGREFTLSGVNIDSKLLGSADFTFVATHDLDLGFEPDSVYFTDINKLLRYFFTGSVENVVFEEVTDERVVYNHSVDVIANSVIFGENRATAYVSLVAFLLVKAYQENKVAPKIIINHLKYNQQESEYSELLVLKDYGNRLLTDLLELKAQSSWGLQPEWEAFVSYHRQRGEMLNEYSAVEKRDYLKSNFEVGDVVLLYRRSKPSSGRSINRLKSCYPAVITDFTEKGVTLTYYPIVETRMTRHSNLSAIEDDIEDSLRTSIYTLEDYERFVVSKEYFDYTELGVDACTWDEPVFFIRPVDTDGSYQFFNTGSGSIQIFLSTLDTIYAVFEDRKVPYNKEKFLSDFFTPFERVPVYEKYRQFN